MEEFIEKYEKAMHRTATYRIYYLLATVYRMKEKELEVLRSLIDERLEK